MIQEEKELINRLVLAIQNYYPTLNVVGADEPVLASLTQHFTNIPPLLLALITKCNGSFPFTFFSYGMELMDGELMMAAQYMAQEHEFAVDLADGEDDMDVDGKIEPIFYHHQRIPFATCNGDADLLLDFAPSTLGQAGQVIYQDVECGVLKCIAPSLSIFLADYVADLSNHCLGKNEHNELVFITNKTWL